MVEVFSFYDWLNYDLRCTFLCTDAVAGSRLTLNSPSPWKRMGCLIACRSKNPASISTKFGYLTLWCIKYVCIKSKVCQNIFFDKKDTFWEKNTHRCIIFCKSVYIFCYKHSLFLSFSQNLNHTWLDKKWYRNDNFTVKTAQKFSPKCISSAKSLRFQTSQMRPHSHIVLNIMFNIKTLCLKFCVLLASTFSLNTE